MWSYAGLVLSILDVRHFLATILHTYEDRRLTGFLLCQEHQRMFEYHLLMERTCLNGTHRNSNNNVFSQLKRSSLGVPAVFHLSAFFMACRSSVLRNHGLQLVWIGQKRPVLLLRGCHYL